MSQAQPRQMVPGSNGSLVLAVLRESPSTSNEVASLLGWSARKACSHIWLLWQRGKLTRTVHTVVGQKKTYLWGAAS